MNHPVRCEVAKRHARSRRRKMRRRLAGARQEGGSQTAETRQAALSSDRRTHAERQQIQ